MGRIAIWLKPLDQGCHARDLSALWGVTWVKLYAQSIMIKTLFDTRKSVRYDGGFMTNHWDVIVIGRLYRLFFGCLDYNIRLWLWRAYRLFRCFQTPTIHTSFARNVWCRENIPSLEHVWNGMKWVHNWRGKVRGWYTFISKMWFLNITQTDGCCQCNVSLCLSDVQAQGIAPSAKLPKNRSNLTSFAGQQALGSLLCGSSKELQPGRRPGPQCALGGVANWTDWMVQYDIYLWGFGIFHHDPESKIFPWKTCWKSWIMALSATVCRWLFGQRMKWFRWTINKHVLCNGPLKFTQRLIQITYSYLMLHKSYIVGHSYSSIMLHNIL